MPIQETTLEAYRRIAAALPTIKLKLMAYWRMRGDTGATDYEAARDTGIKRLTVGATRNDLYHGRLVLDTGRTRLTDSGRPAMVWRVPRAGERVPIPPSKSVSRVRWKQAAIEMRAALLGRCSSPSGRMTDEAIEAIDKVDELLHQDEHDE